MDKNKEQDVIDRLEKANLDRINKKIDKKIKRVHKTVTLFEKILHELIEKKENGYLGERCNCKKVNFYNFINTEKINKILCLNCGGYIEPEEINMWH